MSHVVEIKTEMRDLNAITAACKRLGWTLKENQTSYRWFGQWMDDSPVPRHMFADEAEYQRVIKMSKTDRSDYMTKLLGKCDHAISVPGCRYEIGLIKRGNNYQPAWDWYYQGGLKEHMKEDGGPLLQAYAIEMATMTAKQQGYHVAEQPLDNGTVKLTLTRGY